MVKRAKLIKGSAYVYGTYMPAFPQKKEGI